jgi:hypothetical protein
MIGTAAFCAVATGTAHAEVQNSVDAGASIAWGLGVPMLVVSFFGWLTVTAFPRLPGEKLMMATMFLFGLAAVAVGIAVHFRIFTP